MAIYHNARLRLRDFLRRRPHRSFRRTYRRDYVRSLKLPGYWSFTLSVYRVILQHKKLFLGLALLYGLLTVALIGIASQDTYTQLRDTLRDTGGQLLSGNWGELGKASLLVTTAMTGLLNTNPTDLQRVYALILGLLAWLTTVWLLRSLLAGQKPKLRDGLYNAGSPFLSTFLVAAVGALQLLPIAIAVMGFAAASSTGLLDEGIEAMIFWVAAGALATLSLYWISSTFIALIVVTLPGVYPMQAIKMAGDLVVGRRIRILFRFLWLLMTVGLAWVVIMIPLILFDAWLKAIWPSIQWLPLVPIVLLVLSALTIVWASSYIYLLYRKVVDDDAAPA